MNNEQRDKYIQAGGTLCPFCNSNDIESGKNTYSEPNYLEQAVHCHDCGEEWIDCYQLNDVRVR